MLYLNTRTKDDDDHLKCMFLSESWKSGVDVPVVDTDLDLSAGTVKIYFNPNNTIGTDVPIETAMRNYEQLKLVTEGNTRRLRPTNTSIDDASKFTFSKISTLDVSYPMSFLRANTVVNFGRL